MAKTWTAKKVNGGNFIYDETGRCVGCAASMTKALQIMRAVNRSRAIIKRSRRGLTGTPDFGGPSIKLFSGKIPKDYTQVTSGSTMACDLVWNKDKHSFEKVDCVNEYVSEYIAVIRPIDRDFRK